MSTPTPSHESAHPDPLRDWTAQHLPALAELVEIGMDLARMIRAQAATAAQSETPADIGDIGQKFARVARAVRQTVALGSKLADDLDGLYDRAETRRLVQRRADDARALAARKALGATRKAQAAEIFECAAEIRAPESDREDLFSDLHEWLCETGVDETFAELPVCEVVNQICRDLGVAPDWSRYDLDALERLDRRPSLKATAFAVWPPGATDQPSSAGDDGEPPPPPAAFHGQAPDQPQAP